jgi:hypothetical protein
MRPTREGLTTAALPAATVGLWPTLATVALGATLAQAHADTDRS